MAKNDMMAKIISWSFIIGIGIAGLVGLYTAYTIETDTNFLLTTNGGYVAWVLAIIGVIVGILADCLKLQHLQPIILTMYAMGIF